MRDFRFLWSVACAGTLLLIATACGTDSSAPTETVTTIVTEQPSATTQVPTATAPATRPAAPPPTRSTTVAALPACDVKQLRGSLGQPDGTAGTVYIPIVLTNESSASCAMQGYPRVEFVGFHNGTTLGEPADRLMQATAGSSAEFELLPHARAEARLAYTDVVVTPDCDIEKADGLRVYPPHSKLALYIPFPSQTCAKGGVNVIHVGPVHLG